MSFSLPHARSSIIHPCLDHSPASGPPREKSRSCGRWPPGSRSWRRPPSCTPSWSTTVRRVESRITTPSLDVPVDLLKTRLARGGPLASFGEFPIDWSEVRLLIRQITDVLRRMDVIDQASAARLHAAGREASLPERARAWYEAPMHPDAVPAEEDTDPMWPKCCSGR